MLAIMLTGEKVAAIRALLDWTYAQTAAAVRAHGAKNVRYQHIQQLEENPTRSPRYLLELAAAFGMTAEQFRAWTPGQPVPALANKRAPGVSHPAYTEDIASQVRQLSLALIVLGDWIRETRPVEAKLLHKQLLNAARTLGVDEDQSALGLVIGSVGGASAAQSLAGDKGGQ